MNRKVAVLFSILLFSLILSVVNGDVVTHDAFNVNFNAGESLNYQDTYNNLNVTFTVVSGTLNGTATLDASNVGGTFIVTPTASGVLAVTSTNSTVNIFLDGDRYTSSFAFTSGTSFTVTWNFYVVPPVIMSGETFYFRSDSYQTNTVTAYGLDTDFTNTGVYLSSNGATGATVQYGFRIYQLHTGGSKTELTGGSPEATISLSSNSSGYQTSTWTCAETDWSLGRDALQIAVYVKFDSGNWTAVANYVTPSIMSGTLEASTWTFRVYLYYSDTGAATQTRFYFGSASYKSAILGVDFADADIFAMMLFALVNGDLIMFFRLPLDLIFGAWWYFIIILAVSGAFYIRYRNIVVILILFVLFGGTGGLVGALIPSPVDVAIWVLLSLGLTGILWRVFR
jgi:hypothetical protein